MVPLLLLLLFAGTTASLLVGSAGIGGEHGAAVLGMRGARTACAALAGAGLAVAGVLVQGLFRNPLASPDLIGTTAGAGLGAKVALLGHAALAVWLPAWWAPELLLPLGCLAGAAGALALLWAIARRLGSGGEALVGLVLAGWVLSAVIGAAAAGVVVLAQDSWQLGRALVATGLGGFDGAGWRHALLASPLVLAGLAAAWCWSRPLDLLLAGEDEAASLGLDVARSRRWIMAWAAALTAAAVAMGGMAAFAGLVVPHLLRGRVGAGHRRLVPACAIGGAAFLVWCDVGARGLPLLAAPWRAVGELPLSVVTALVGAPLFLWLLLRARREGWA